MSQRYNYHAAGSPLRDEYHDYDAYRASKKPAKNDVKKRFPELWTYAQNITWGRTPEDIQDEIIAACYRYHPQSERGQCRACGSQSLVHVDRPYAVFMALTCPMIRNGGIPLESGRIASVCMSNRRSVCQDAPRQEECWSEAFLALKKENEELKKENEKLTKNLKLREETLLQAVYELRKELNEFHVEKQRQEQQKPNSFTGGSPMFDPSQPVEDFVRAAMEAHPVYHLSGKEEVEKQFPHDRKQEAVSPIEDESMKQYPNVRNKSTYPTLQQALAAFPKAPAKGSIPVTSSSYYPKTSVPSTTRKDSSTADSPKYDAVVLKILKEIGGFNEKMIKNWDLDSCRKCASLVVDGIELPKMASLCDSFPDLFPESFSRELTGKNGWKEHDLLKQKFKEIISLT